MENNAFDFDAFVKQAGEQLRAGKPLVGSEELLQNPMPQRLQRILPTFFDLFLN